MPRPTVDQATSTGPTKIRQVRVPEELWRESCAKALDEGGNISSVVRELLRGYVAGDIVLGAPVEVP